MLQQANSWMREALAFRDNSNRYRDEKNLRDIQDDLSGCEMFQLSAQRFLDKTKLPNLPDSLIDLGHELTVNTSIELDGAILQALAGISNSTQGKIKIVINDRWNESASIWPVYASESGSGKTIVKNTLQLPYSLIQKKIHDNYINSGIKNYENRKVIKEVIYSAKKTEIKKLIHNNGEITESDINSITQLINSLDEKEQTLNSAYPELYEMSIISDNLTPNQLITLLWRNRGNVYISSSEGAILSRLIKNADKDLSPFLKSYDQESIIVQKGNRTITIENPFLEIAIFTQPNIAYKFYSNESLNDIGICARTVPFISVPYEDRINEYKEEKPNNTKLISKYKEAILSFWEKFSNPRIDVLSIPICITSEALDLLNWYCNKLKEDELPYCPILMRPFLEKCPGKVVRIANALHMWCNLSDNSSITADDIGCAIDIMNVSLHHANFIYNDLGFKAYEDAKTILKDLLKIDKYKRHDIINSGLDSRSIQQRTGLNKKDTDNALAILDKHNYLFRYDNGSPNIRFMLNRHFYTGFLNPMIEILKRREGASD